MPWYKSTWFYVLMGVLFGWVVLGGIMGWSLWAWARNKYRQVEGKVAAAIIPIAAVILHRMIA